MVPLDRRAAMLRRLRAEASEDSKFSLTELGAQIEACALQGCAIGPTGFDPKVQICAVLLPTESTERPMVLGLGP